ncbi:hypothetical protein RHS03_06545, partial [Rhizoctonia solani]
MHFFVALALAVSVIAAPPPIIQDLNAGLQPVESVADTQDPVPRADDNKFQSCYILVKNANDGNELGYFGRRWKSGGWYGLEEKTLTFTGEYDSPLQVRFSYLKSNKHPSRLDFRSMNGGDWFGTQATKQSEENVRKYPYVGAALLKTVNEDIVGTKSAPPDSPPPHGNHSVMMGHAPSEYESAIWTYDPVTNDIRAQLISGDGSSPKGSLYYLGGSDAFAITNAINKFKGSKTIVPVTLTCVRRLVPS